MTARPSMHPIELTPVQVEVLTRVARGQQQPTIARDMNLKINTVRSTFRDLFVRLGADNAPHAVALAIGLGILPTTVATHHTTTLGEPHVR